MNDILNYRLLKRSFELLFIFLMLTGCRSSIHSYAFLAVVPRLCEAVGFWAAPKTKYCE